MDPPPRSPHNNNNTSSARPSGSAAPPPYDPLLPTPALSTAPRRSPPSSAAAPSDNPSTQITLNPNPVSMDTPTETPHDLFCLAKEYERRGRISDAANLYLKASMNGHLSAMVSYATHLVPSDERTAFVWFRAAAERGDPRAWSELGQLLARGRYFEVNAVDAARCWKRAAQMGDNAGKSALGLCYIRGFGVKQDLEKGIEIVRQVADVHNDITAMKNLAWIFRYGKAGVPRNLEEADYWDNRAKEQEKIMSHITSREHVLFGRSRSSRHSKHKSRDSDRHSRPSSARDSNLSDKDATNGEDDARRSDGDRESARSKALVVDELESRLRDVSDDVARFSPQPARSSAESPAPELDSPQFRSFSPNFVRDPNPATEGNTQRTDPLIVRDQPTPPPETQPSHVAGRSDPPAAAKEASPPEDTTISELPTGSSAERKEPYGQDDTVRTQPDPVLGAEVADLAFVQKSMEEERDPPQVESQQMEPRPALEPETLTEQEQEQEQEPQPPLRDPFNVAAAEKDDVQNMVPKKPALPPPLNKPIAEDRARQRSSDLDARRAAAGAVSPSSQFSDEHFITPEGSIDNGSDMADVNRGQEPGEAGTAFGTGSGAHLEPMASTSLPRAMPMGADRARRDDDDFPMDPPAMDESPLARRPSGGFVPTVPRDHELGPGVRTRKRFFETTDDSAEPAPMGASDFRRSPTYSLKPQDRSHPRNSEVEQFENDGMREASPGEVDDDSGRLNALRDAEFSERTRMEDVDDEGDDPGMEGATGDHSPRGVDVMEEELEQPTLGDDDESLEALQQLMSRYPSNPMRADAKVPLMKLINCIQSFSVSNTAAYSILERGNGCGKVVVAMVAHASDEGIQEGGLHCFVRIMRSLEAADREPAVMLPYADCFRSVQGSDDVVVPKGSGEIDERASGVIQAVVQAMREHASVRRIQLAGCASLSEIAQISPSCRSIAYELGSVNLIMNNLRHRSTKAAASVHDVASRTVSSFCASKENMAFKEAFTHAGAASDLLNILQLWGHAEEEESELLISATNSCMTAVRHLTDGHSTASVQCVQNFAYHHLIRVMVRRRTNVTVCTLALAALTSVTRNSGAVAEKGLTDANPLPEVLATMQVHSDNALFIRKALDFMEALGSFSSMREEIVAAGGIPFAADILQQGGSDALLLERACGVVEKLCRSNPGNQEIFGSHNGIQSLTALLESHQRFPGVMERTLLAITSVCTSNGENQRESMRVGTPEELVRVLTTYVAKNPKVVAASASAMAAVVVPKNAPVAQTLAGLKAPEYIVRSMKKHSDSVVVQENGSAAISAFCEADPRIMGSLLKSGISSILIVALQRFLHKQTAVVQIVRAMRAITNEVCAEDSYRFKTKLLSDRSNESSLPEIFHTALSFHKKSLPETANVIISICATINRLCMRSVAFKNEIGKDGIVEELKKLVERTAEYKDLGALQPVLATICTLVLESEENKNRFHGVGGVEAILDVMQKWKHDTYVLEHCCAALRYSCNDHFGNCNEVKNHNGVRSILGVMEMHPENVNVNLWCCLTLADLCKKDEELQSSATVVQGIRKVVSAMNMFSQNSRFLSSACEFLRAASESNTDNQERIVRLGGRTAIVKALENHPTDNTLTESASYALLLIQDIADPRSSMDSSSQLGIVKRWSRDLRRSGSSSNRSNRSSKASRMGRKSFSFGSRRRPTDEDEEEAEDDPADVEESRPSKPSSLGNLRRILPRRRSRHARSAGPDVEDSDGQDVGNEEFEDYGAANSGRDSDVQLE